jgi:3-dehydroquinate synthase
LAVLLGRLDEAIVARQDRLLEALHLPTSPQVAGPIEPATLLAIMGRDKKALHGKLRFVLPDAIGHVDLVDGVDPAAVERVLLAG